jgi:hypothetical protein
MKIQDTIISANKDATDALFKAARRVPADKLDWKPLDEGRSVLDICAEVALSPTWPLGLAFSPEPFQMTDEIMAELTAEKAALKSLDQCEATAAANLATFNEAVANVPDEKFETTVTVTFSPTPEWSFFDALMVHHWNAVYHAGQINYIQTLYGDKGMG